MNARQTAPTIPSAAQVAEAAAWVAHLHSADRTADSDRGLKLWIKDDPARQRAWELATDAWEDLHLLKTADVVQGLEATRRIVRTRRRTVQLMVAAAAVLVIGVVALFVPRQPTFATGVGEQRTIALEDGSQVTLNTGTRVTVSYSNHRRGVELEQGEAMFDVARVPGRPFVVIAGGRQIEALGTAFVVRRDRARVSVTLMDGKVSVSGIADSDARAAGEPSGGPAILTPGERLILSDGGSPQLDRPAIEKLTAWRSGKVVFERIRLEDAIAEMNRYSTHQLSVRDARAAEVHVSGVFKYGDSRRFAQAVAATYRLRVLEADGEIALVGSPERAYR